MGRATAPRSAPWGCRRPTRSGVCGGGRWPGSSVSLRLAERRLVDWRPGEAGPALWSFAYFFFVLASYYVLRPVRDEVGAAGGPERLPWLFTATFLTMLAAALTIVTQVAVTGRLVRRLDLPRVLAILPALSVAGLAALARSPTAAVLIPLQMLWRATQYAIAGPAREMLFTVVSREDKYKAKNLIDTVVYRGGDVLSGWTFAALAATGVGWTGLAAVAMPLAAGWLAVAVYLGRRQRRLRRQLAAEVGDGP